MCCFWPFLGMDYLFVTPPDGHTTLEAPSFQENSSEEEAVEAVFPLKTALFD